MSSFFPLLPDGACLDCKCRTMRVFCNLSPEALADFSALGMKVTLPRGATLFREGEPADRIVVLCSGQVKLSCGSREGRTLNLRIAVEGDVLGLSGVISGGLLEVTAETLVATCVKVIRRAEFLLFLASHADASMRVAQTLAEEYRSVFQDARRLALSGSVAGRLASLLLEWSKSMSEGEPGVRFTMALTHDELANFAGTSRETVSRTLGRFQREKLIRIQGSSVYLLAPEALANLVA